MLLLVSLLVLVNVTALRSSDLFRLTFDPLPPRSEVKMLTMLLLLLVAPNTAAVFPVAVVVVANRLTPLKPS